MNQVFVDWKYSDGLNLEIVSREISRGSSQTDNRSEDGENPGLVVKGGDSK